MTGKWPGQLPFPPAACGNSNTRVRNVFLPVHLKGTAGAPILDEMCSITGRWDSKLRALMVIGNPPGFNATLNRTALRLAAGTFRPDAAKVASAAPRGPRPRGLLFDTVAAAAPPRAAASAVNFTRCEGCFEMLSVLSDPKGAGLMTLQGDNFGAYDPATSTYVVHGSHHRQGEEAVYRPTPADAAAAGRVRVTFGQARNPAVRSARGGGANDMVYHQLAFDFSRNASVIADVPVCDDMGACPYFLTF